MNDDQIHNLTVLRTMHETLRSLRETLRTMPFDDTQEIMQQLHATLKQDSPVEASIYTALGTIATVVMMEGQPNVEALGVMGCASFIAHAPGGTDLIQSYVNCGQGIRGILAINALMKDAEDTDNVIFIREDLVEAATDEILRRKQKAHDSRPTNLN